MEYYILKMNSGYWKKSNFGYSTDIEEARVFTMEDLKDTFNIEEELKKILENKHDKYKLIKKEEK